MLWIDTHAHLDAPEFAGARDAMLRRARDAGVVAVIPAVLPAAFDAVRALAHEHGHAYALGVHPLYVDRVEPEAFDALRAAVDAALDDPHFVAIGEIGLDLFVPDVDRARQDWWYGRQLDLARAHGLPVLLHSRRANDPVCAGLRRRGWGSSGPGGIAHAFNGSPEQAAVARTLGLRLGFGGAMTFERALNIRRLAADAPDESLVLETDAPDIPPAWLGRGAGAAPNEPAQLPRIAATLAELRGWSAARVAAVTAANARAALPRLHALLSAREAGGA